MPAIASAGTSAQAVCTGDPTPTPVSSAAKAKTRAAVEHTIRRTSGVRARRAQPACDDDNAREREQLGAIACRPDRSERDSDRQAGSLDLGERSDRRDRSRSWQGASEERKACCVTGARRQERVHDRAGTVVRPRDDERDATAGPAGSGAPGRTRARRRRDKARKREREERPIPAAEHSARLAQVAAYGIDHRLQFRHVPRDPVLQAGDELGAALCQRAAWLTAGW